MGLGERVNGSFGTFMIIGLLFNAVIGGNLDWSEVILTSQIVAWKYPTVNGAQNPMGNGAQNQTENGTYNWCGK